MKKFMFWCVCCFMVLTCVQYSAWSADKGVFKTAPQTNKGEKWRLGYYEFGPYNSYYNSFLATVEGLMELGWIEKSALPTTFAPDNTAGLWGWLSSNTRSNYVVFVGDAFFSAKADNDLRTQVKKKLLHRLNTQKDIDLMIVMGTKAGQDMANNEHSVPTVIGSTTDAVAAGIIKSPEDSGYDHIHAQIDPGRHEQQISLFYDIIGFKRLGVAYRDNEAGRGMAAIDSVEKIAKERGFQIIPCDLNTIVPGTGEDQQKEEKVVKCHELLAPKIDAMYITRYSGGVTYKNMPNLLAPLIANKIPTFSQAGSDEVKRGVLLSIALSRFTDVGLFYAESIAKILNGAKPRMVNQIFQYPPKIAINLETANRIGFDPPVDVLGVADEIYQDVYVDK